MVDHPNDSPQNDNAGRGRRKPSIVDVCSDGRIERPSRRALRGQ